MEEFAILEYFLFIFFFFGGATLYYFLFFLFAEVSIIQNFGRGEYETGKLHPNPVQARRLRDHK